jgi:hypothetical protein
VTAQQSAPQRNAAPTIPRLAIDHRLMRASPSKTPRLSKTQEDHLIKDKKTEVNVKTNMQGIARSQRPSDVLIQLLRKGGSPGHWYDIVDSKQVVKIR